MHLRSPTWPLWILASTLLFSSCGETCPSEGTPRIVRVDYSITGRGMDDIAGWINTSAPGSTPSVEVFGIPVGERFVVDMWATPVGATMTCVGSAMFDVALTDGVDACGLSAPLGGVRIEGAIDDCNATAQMPVVAVARSARCRGSDRTRDGDNMCPELRQLTVSPLQAGDGLVIDVAMKAFDAEGDPLHYRLSATGGDFYYPNEPETRYSCTDATDETLRFETSDDRFRDCIDAWSVDIRCVDAQPSALSGRDCR